jgi:hypothetical protein
LARVTLCPIAEVNNRFVQGAAAAADSKHALRSHHQAVVKNGGAGFKGFGFELRR